MGVIAARIIFCSIILTLNCLHVRAQGYPTFEKHVAGLIRQGEYDAAVKALESNRHQFDSDTGKTECFNWLASLYLLQKKWDRYITLYQDYEYLPDEDSTLLSASRFFRSFREEISVDPGRPWIPFTTSRWSNTPRVKIKINGKKYRFWVDTGAGMSVVTDKVARKCGLKQYKPGRSSAISATGNAVGIDFAVIDSLQGAGLSVKNHPCLVLRKNDLKFRFLGITIVKIHGLIGWNLLQELTVDIDFPGKRLRFALPGKKVNKNNNFYWMDQPMVSVSTEQGEPLSFFIDTGASDSELYEAAYGKIDTTGAVSKKIVLGSAGGTSTMRTVILPQIKITVSGQTLVMKNIPVIPAPYNNGVFKRHGVLGTHELKSYLLHFSLKEGVFRLTPP